MEKVSALEKQIFRQIGLKLKELRIKSGYTSYENFAFEFELSSRYYWGVENGKNISLRYLIQLLRIHKVSLADFFADLDKID